MVIENLLRERESPGIGMHRGENQDGLAHEGDRHGFLCER